jgi:hypothetical protein
MYNVRLFGIGTTNPPYNECMPIIMKQNQNQGENRKMFIGNKTSL